MFKILRLSLLSLGIAILLNGLVLSFTTNFNIGNILTLLFGSFFLIFGIKFKILLKILPRWIKGLIALFLVVSIGFSSFLMIFGLTDSTDYKEDAIIVLGAAVHGETPSLVLKDRLDKAAEYHKKNPAALIIVSGGKGPQESISEAAAMEKYLISKGVDESVIIKEDAATSTYENFVFSKKILDENFGSGYKIAFISNEYHICRAKNISENAGFSEINSLHSNTRWYSVLPGVLRECLAVTKFWIFGD